MTNETDGKTKKGIKFLENGKVYMMPVRIVTDPFNGEDGSVVVLAECGQQFPDGKPFEIVPYKTGRKLEEGEWK